MQLVKGHRDRQQQQVVHPPGQVGIGGVGQQAEPRRQHLAGARAGALDRPGQVEPLLQHVADVFAQHVLVQRVVGDRTPDEDDPGPPHDRAHRPERHVDPGEQVRRRQSLLLQGGGEHQRVQVRPVRPQQDARVPLQRRAQPLDLGLVIVDLRVEPPLEDQPPDDRHHVDEPAAPARGQLVQDAPRFGQRRRRPGARGLRVRPGFRGQRPQPGPEPARGEDFLLDQARRLVPGPAELVLGPVERERGPAGHVGGEAGLRRRRRCSRSSAAAARRRWRAGRPARRPGPASGPGSAAAGGRRGDTGPGPASGR